MKKRIEQVKASVARKHGLTVDALNRKTRGSPREARARIEAMVLCRRLRPRPDLETIGLAFGRHHSNVSHAVRNWTRRRALHIGRGHPSEPYYFNPPMPGDYLQPHA